MYCGVLSNDCCEVSSPRKTLSESSAASLRKLAIACTSCDVESAATLVDPVDEKGAIAELEIATAAIKLGVSVYKPVSEHSRADLLFEIGSQVIAVGDQAFQDRDAPF